MKNLLNKIKGAFQVLIVAVTAASMTIMLPVVSVDLPENLPGGVSDSFLTLVMDTIADAEVGIDVIGEAEAVAYIPEAKWRGGGLRRSGGFKKSRTRTKSKPKPQKSQKQIQAERKVAQQKARTSRAQKASKNNSYVRSSANPGKRIERSNGPGFGRDSYRPRGFFNGGVGSNLGLLDYALIYFMISSVTSRGEAYAAVPDMSVAEGCLDAAMAAEGDVAPEPSPECRDIMAKAREYADGRHIRTEENKVITVAAVEADLDATSIEMQNIYADRQQDAADRAVFVERMKIAGLFVFAGIVLVVLFFVVKGIFRRRQGMA